MRQNTRGDKTFAFKLPEEPEREGKGSATDMGYAMGSEVTLFLLVSTLSREGSMPQERL